MSFLPDALHVPPCCTPNVAPAGRFFSIGTESEDPNEGGPSICVVHIAETDEQKCSRLFTAAIVPIATGAASIAGLASVPKRGLYDGAALSGSGRGPVHCGGGGGIGGCQPCGESAKLKRVEWICDCRGKRHFGKSAPGSGVPEVEPVVVHCEIGTGRQVSSVAFKIHALR